MREVGVVSLDGARPVIERHAQLQTGAGGTERRAAGATELVRDRQLGGLAWHTGSGLPVQPEVQTARGAAQSRGNRKLPDHATAGAGEHGSDKSGAERGGRA